MKQVNILMTEKVHRDLKIYAVLQSISMGRAIEQLLAMAQEEIAENFNPADCEWTAEIPHQK